MKMMTKFLAMQITEIQRITIYDDEVRSELFWISPRNDDKERGIHVIADIDICEIINSNEADRVIFDEKNRVIEITYSTSSHEVTYLFTYSNSTLYPRTLGIDSNYINF